MERLTCLNTIFSYVAELLVLYFYSIFIFCQKFFIKNDVCWLHNLLFTLNISGLFFICKLFDLQVLDREGQMDNPCTSWLTDSSWDNVTELDKLPNFHGIMNSFEQYPKDWNSWFTNAAPESAPLPGLSTASFFINLASCIITCFYLYVWQHI